MHRRENGKCAIAHSSIWRTGKPYIFKPYIFKPYIFKLYFLGLGEAVYNAQAPNPFQEDIDRFVPVQIF
jgi:hypothetical protein